MSKIKILNKKQALQFLKKTDPELKYLLNSFEIDELKPEKNYFKSLTRTIIYQQLSGKAAKTILDRFISLYNGKKFPTPNDVIETENGILYSIGISRAKAQYIKNISLAFLNETIDYKNLDNLCNDEITKQLVDIKGIGPWTAQMFLMFTLNRSDVFPSGDLGVQKGFQQYFKLKELPSPTTMEKRAEKWKPFRTMVSLYLWKVVDGPFEW